MATYHIIRDGFVINTVVAEVDELSKYFPECIFVDASRGGSVGDRYENGAFEDLRTQIEPIPAAVTMRQARLALLDLDLLSSIDGAINAMPEPDKTKAKIEWEYAAVVERNSDWVSDLGQQLGLSDVQIDDLFQLAATK